MKFFEELKRRNVIKATMAYLVVAWVLIQVLTNILPVFQAPDWVLQILMILLAIGLPIWMTFSWVYDVTPEGIKKTSDIATDESVTATTNKRLNILILILLTIAIGLNFVDMGDSEKVSEAVASTPEIQRDNSIAVLPFLDMSPLKDQEHYSDGIAIEILNALCKFNTLKVVGRTSSFAFKDKDEDIKSIGRKLHVNNILEGSVQKQEEQIRISVRLTNAEDGYTLFSESYTDAVENIFDLQSRIATDIAEKIESKLELANNKLHPRKKIDPLAYETFLKGKIQFVNGPLNMKKAEIFEAKEYFERAVELDSNFAEAYAYLSLIYLNMADWALPGEDMTARKKALDSAKELGQKAYDLDPLSSGAHLAMGSLHFHEYDWVQAEVEKRKAVELNPGGAEEKFILASFLSQFGQPEEALSLADEALELSPLDPVSEINYIKILYFGGRYEEALARCNQMIVKGQALSGAYQFQFASNVDIKRYEEAGKSWAMLLKEMKQEDSALLFLENDFKTAVKKFLELHERKELSILDLNVYKASFYAYLEDKDNALKYLSEAYRNRESYIVFMKFPRFEFLREDPRYIELYEKAGLKAYDEQLKRRRVLASVQ